MSAVLLPLPPGVRTLTNEESGRLRAKDSTLPSAPTRARCITCRGAGEFKWWSGTGDDRTIEAYECPCADQWLLHRFLLNAGLGLTYQRLGWADVVAAEPRAVATVQDYMEHAEGYVANGVGLFFHGGNRTGKTLLSTLLLKYLLGQGVDGYFVPFSTILDMLTAGWRDKEEQEHFYRKVKNTTVLVIDDPGKETRQRKFKVEEGESDTRSSALAKAAFDEVLRHRAASAKPTIVAANLTAEQLRVDYGAHLVQLLTESAINVEFRNPSFVDGARMRLDEEIRLGLQRPLVIG